MLQTAGMDKAAMMEWHAEFESRSPEAHHNCAVLFSLTVSFKLSVYIRIAWILLKNYPVFSFSNGITTQTLTLTEKII